MLFSPFSIAITSLGGCRTFVRFALVWFCLFPLPLGVWEGLRLVIVALPGLYSYFFFIPFNNAFIASETVRVSPFSGI